MKVNGVAQRRPRKVFVVDDHDGIRLSFEIILAGQDDLEYCGGVKEYFDALPEIKRRRPDLVLVDLKLDGRGGIELTKEILRLFPGTAVLIYSGYDEERYGVRAYRAGAHGFLEKGAGLEETRAVIRTVLQGRLYFKEQTLRSVKESIRRCHLENEPGRVERDVDLLSDREFEIFGLLGRGLPPKEIATRMKLSPATIRTHRKRIKKKLGYRRTTQLVQFAARWVEGEEPVLEEPASMTTP